MLERTKYLLIGKSLGWLKKHQALERSAIEYVIDGDQEYRNLEKALKEAEQRNDGHKIAEYHDKIDAIGGYAIKARAAELLNGLGF